MQAWVVIDRDNNQVVWLGTWKAKLSHRFPKMDSDGFVWLDGFPYVVDPSLCTREKYRPRKYLYLIEKEDQYFYWRMNEPAQISLLDPTLTPGSVGITGATIKTFAESQHLKRLVQPEGNYWAIVAIMALVVAALSLVGYAISSYHK